MGEPGEVTRETVENLGSLAKEFEPYLMGNRDPLKDLELRSNRMRTIL